MSIRKFRAARINTTTGNTYVGQYGDMFYDEGVGLLKISDGSTPGGHFVSVVPATSTVVGGIKAGPGANVATDGTLTINTAGLPLSFGDFTATNGNLFVVNPNEDMNILTNGTGNINLVGNLRIQTTSSGPYYTTPVLSVDNAGNLIVNGNLITNGHSYFIGSEVNTGNVTVNGNLIVNGPSYFTGNVAEIGNLTVTGNAVNNGFSTFNGNVTTTGNLNIVGNLYQTGNNVVTGSLIQYGTTTMVVSTASSTQGAVEITGDPTGLSQTPVNTGVMLHVTGQTGQVGRVYNDSIANYSLYVGRRFEGTMASPTGVQGNVDLLRVAGTPYTSAGWANIGPARITFTTNEIQTGTNQGGRIEFWTTANASGPAYSTVSRTATIDPALGITTIGLTSSDGIVASGNVTVGNTVVYSTATGDAGSVTQTGTKATAVTSNGRSGRIVMNGASLAGQTPVTFTVNNNYIKNVSDVPIVSIQSPVTTPNNYLVSVSGVAVGSFNITLYNTDSGAGSSHSDAVVLNYAIIRVGS
jgi:hypothetical protein